MTDPRRVPVRRSVFARLVAVLVVMAASLLALVAAFFFVVVRPALGEHHGLVLQELTRVLASSGLDRERATELARRLSMPIRYEGPSGSWSTSGSLPTIAEARASERLDTDFVVRPAPDGGAYVFAWDFRRPLEEAHTQLVFLLLGLMVAVVIAAHVVIRRALRPLRVLSAGVARLGEGDLEVAVPNDARDELGALTDAFNDMVRRVRDMVRARDQLLLDVSHELRSPMTRMKVALALLPADDKTERLLADLAEMETLVGGLIELERLRDGKGVQRADVDLEALLRDVTASFAGMAPGVEIAAVPADLHVVGDGERLRIAVRNVVENALKYSLPDSKPVSVAATRAADRIEVRVRDDGVGIPAADLPRIFEPFFRVDRSRSKKTGGHGLGLSLCRRIVRAHGGDVTARSDGSARGTTFVIAIPVNAATRGTSAPVD